MTSTARPGVRRRAARAWQLIRAGDMPRLIHACLDVVPGEVLHFDTLYVLQAVDPGAGPRTAGELKVDVARREDIPGLNRVFPREGAASYDRRFADGAVGILCHHGRTPCGMAWLELGGEHVEEAKFCTFELPVDGAWVYDVSVATEWQGRGIGTLLFQQCIGYARARGRRRSLACVSRGNRPSLKAAERAGYRPVQRVSVLSLLGIRIHRQQDLHEGGGTDTRIGFRRWARIPAAPDRSEAHSRLETNHA